MGFNEQFWVVFTDEVQILSAFPVLFKSEKAITHLPKEGLSGQPLCSFFCWINAQSEHQSPLMRWHLLQAELGRRSVFLKMLNYNNKHFVCPQFYILPHRRIRWKLSVLAPEAEGYTGAGQVFQNFWGKGLSVHHAHPGHLSLHIQGVWKDAKSILVMPVQVLALYAQDCEPGSCSDSIDFESVIGQL